MPYIRLATSNNNHLFEKQDSGYNCNQSSISEDSQQDTDSFPMKLKMIELPSEDNQLEEKFPIVEESVTIDDVTIDLQSKIENILMDINAPLNTRFNAMFYLRSMGNYNAINCMVKTLTEISINDNTLLEHEMAHILGQMLGIADHEIISENTLISAFSRPEYNLVRDSLEKILADSERDTTTRHEAGESLGAILSINSLSILDKYADEKFEDSQEVRETCYIAACRIRWYRATRERVSMSDYEKNLIEKQLTNRNPFMTVDPAPAMYILEDPDSNNNTRYQIENACNLLTQPQQDIFVRYRCLFTLRNELVNDIIIDCSNGLNYNKCIGSLIIALNCTSSALLRHEVGFVLGQILSVLNNNSDDNNNKRIRDQILNGLEKTVRDRDESDMVRHEASTGFGECCDHDRRSKDLLVEFSGEDKNSILRDSCIVTLNMAVNNKEWVAQQFGIID